ncbi:MAG: dihydrofolate reductase family protein [Candidatus Thermoplasmatota archaeon]|nr:dihydrofolate reductase family protein [Candidatus Thermoplasmatota archaeon]
MMPKVIIHNSISIDGSLTSFEPNMELHYRIAGMFKPDMHLIGSHTITAGVELYEDGIPPEDASDFKKPKRKKTLPAWVLVDSKGTLEGLLHTCRRFELCRDVLVLVSQKTPKRYLRYLDERQYEYHCIGRDAVDLRQALNLLFEEYHARTILTDTGRILGNLLLNQGLVDEISLLVHPVLVGKKSYGMFHDLERKCTVTLMKSERLEQQYIWLFYRVKKKNIPEE